MKTPFAVRGLSNFVLSAVLGGLVGGCSPQPQSGFPPIIVNVKEKSLALQDGRPLTKCTAPERGSKEAAPGECKGLRQVNVLEVRTITVLTTHKNPDCYVFAWEGYYFEVCY